MTFHYQIIKQEIQYNHFTKTSVLFSKDQDEDTKLDTFLLWNVSVNVKNSTRGYSADTSVNLKVNDFIHPLKMTLGPAGELKAG